MDKDIIISSSLAGNELATAFSEVVAERWDNWNLSPYMAYLVDICAPSLLPYLADQFDVEGLRGFGIAENEEQQRELIKKSIALHKYLGTPWAIREACRTVGFPVIVLEEGVTEPDGITRPEDWARFRVYVEGKKEVTEEEARKLRLFVEYYKNERSHLVDFGFYHSYTDGPLFRTKEESRESLDIYTLTVSPNPVLINPDGGEKIVTVEANTAWKPEALTMYWDDGTGDKLYITVTGQNKLTVKSDINEHADREIVLNILSGEGLLLGTLTIEQHLEWRNAYSRDYSNAYNLYPVQPSNAYSQDYSRAYNTDLYLSLSKNEIAIPDTGETQTFEVYTNTTWEIE